jgi:hypothetical protein
MKVEIASLGEGEEPKKGVLGGHDRPKHPSWVLLPILSPCQTGFAHLDAPEGIAFTQVAAQDPIHGQALLQSADVYWLVSPASIKPEQIPGVQPMTLEAHWDHAAFSPNGSYLAISHLNSRGPKDGINLSIGDTLTAQRSLYRIGT